MTREEIKQKTSLCFLLNPNVSEEEKNCVIENVMATKATIVSKAALCNIITYILKQNAKLKKQVENRNCSNCRRSKTGCPNDGSYTVCNYHSNTPIKWLDNYENKVYEDSIVAWKEIVLPKEIKND